MQNVRIIGDPLWYLHVECRGIKETNSFESKILKNNSPEWKQWCCQ